MTVMPFSGICRNLLLLVLCCILLGGCTPGLFPLGGANKLPAPSVPLVGDARAAWESGNMQRAEALYAQVLTTRGISARERQEAWSRNSMAQARLGRPRQGLKTLDRWSKEDPQAEHSVFWQDAWLTCIRATVPAKAVAAAKKLNTAQHAPGARLMASIYLLGHSWNARQASSALPDMTAAYTQADRFRRAYLERMLLTESASIAPNTLKTLTANLSADKARSYPYTVLLLEQFRRDRLRTPQTTLPLVLSGANVFADQDLVHDVLSGNSTAQQSQGTVQVALALPLSGPVRNIASRICNGAYAARDELGTSNPVTVHVIDTDQADWATRLQNLPPECVVVGGPLQTSLYSQFSAQGITRQRAVFAFLSQLPAGEEGNHAWRFFSSPKDQIQALLRFTKDQLHIRDYAALYPNDSYGPRMSEHFAQALLQSGDTLVKAGYNANNADSRNAAAAQILGVVAGEGVSVPNTPVDAVFVPDSWNQTPLLALSLRSYGKPAVLLMGTALWEQGLSSGATNNLAATPLAIFPGAWDKTNSPAALQKFGTSDIWTGLGYDFVHFVAGLNATQRGSAQEMTRLIREQAQRMRWHLAPLHWDEAGLARQDLFLFTPTSNGYARLNADEFQTRYLQLHTSATPASAASSPEQ